MIVRSNDAQSYHNNPSSTDDFRVEGPLLLTDERGAMQDWFASHIKRERRSKHISLLAVGDNLAS